jgi:hypothetical protein
MPRQNRRRLDEAGPPPSTRGGVAEHLESWRGDDYVVRSLAGSRAAGPYRCPGCDQEIAAGQPHVVAWPAYDTEAADRRHWHTTCWGARDRRSPDVQRGRAAPRH